MVEYGLIGRGISHSFSAKYFNNKFRREGIEAQYLAFDLKDISELHEILLSHTELKGLNVTSPYKREVIPFLNYLSGEASELQSVNVITVERNMAGEPMLVGHNTDCGGFGMTIDGMRINKALIMGTGGASSAVALALRKVGVDSHIVSRFPKGHIIGYDTANLLLPEYDLIVNATPLGMHPNEDGCPPLDLNKLCSSHICYDLIYNPAETLFLRKAKEQGAQTINGMGMLINQAELSWRIWTSLRPGSS